MASGSGRLEAIEGLLDAAERAFANAAQEPYKPSAGSAASFLANVPATISLDRAYLAHLHGDAGGTAAFASRALMELGEGERLLESVARWILAVSNWLRGRLEEAECGLASSIPDGERPASPP